MNKDKDCAAWEVKNICGAVKIRAEIAVEAKK